MPFLRKFNILYVCVQKCLGTALAGVAQWIERWPAKQGVTGPIPSQDTSLGCGPGPQ